MSGLAREKTLSLVGNAIKFTGAGEVRVGAGLNAGEFPRTVVFRVSDTGIGIAADELERVFSEFEQGHRTIEYAGQGSGLGLAISRRLVELHGGRIWVESTPGVGSTFRFSLPVDGPQGGAE